MPTFFQFLDPGNTVVNLNHLANIGCSERVVGQAEAAREAFRFSEGENIYKIDVTIVGGRAWSMEYRSKEQRDGHYREILAILRPIVIGSNPLTAVATAAAPPAPEPAAPVPPVATPLRKPRAKKEQE
jgi:hypothetical protein